MASSMKDLFGFIAKDDSLRTEGQILRLSLGLIEVKPQVRKHFDEEELKALAESIKAVGLQEPLTVMEEDPHSHKYTLVNGERRYRALKLIYGDDFQNTMVECYVRAKPVEENHKKLLQIVDNEVRSGLTVSELVSTIRYLERNGIKRKEIAKALGGVTSAKMTKLYALADYDCPAFLEPLMSMTTSYQNLYLLRNLAKKYPDEVKNFCIECVEEGVFSETQMNTLRAKIKEIESPDINSEKSVDPDHTSDTNKDKEESSSPVKENEPTVPKEASEADSQEAKSVQNPWKPLKQLLEKRPLPQNRKIPVILKKVKVPSRIAKKDKVIPRPTKEMITMILLCLMKGTKPLRPIYLVARVPQNPKNKKRNLLKSYAVSAPFWPLIKLPIS